MIADKNEKLRRFEFRDEFNNGRIRGPEVLWTSGSEQPRAGQYNAQRLRKSLPSTHYCLHHFNAIFDKNSYVDRYFIIYFYQAFALKIEEIMIFLIISKNEDDICKDAIFVFLELNVH